MSERIRSVKVTLEIDTNKRTCEQTFWLGEEQSIDELFAEARARVAEILEEVTS